MQTSVAKDPREGWYAETTVDIAEDKRLCIRTRRARGGVETAAKGYHKSSSGAWSHTMIIGAFSVAETAEADFTCVLDRHEGRVTEPLVRVQHEAALVRIDDIKARAVAHYRAREQFHAHA